MSTTLTLPTAHDVPTLWARAKAMFAVMLETITSTLDLARRIALARAERRHLMSRLVPVEKLVRTLMLVEAATFLLMTPEGRRLRAETRKIAPPPLRGARPPEDPYCTRIPLPGWQSIAAYHHPQPASAPALECASDDAQPATHETHTQSLPCEDDSQDWGCRFKILRWVQPERSAAARASTADVLRRFLPLSAPGAPVARAVPPALQGAAASNADPSTHDLAHRIEALARVLANPAPAIRRLARRLAALSADVLDDFDLAATSTHLWRDGARDYRIADMHFFRARRALIATHKHDPG